MDVPLAGKEIKADRFNLCANLKLISYPLTSHSLLSALMIWGRSALGRLWLAASKLHPKHLPLSVLFSLSHCHSTLVGVETFSKRSMRWANILVVSSNRDSIFARMSWSCLSKFALFSWVTF